MPVPVHEVGYALFHGGGRLVVHIIDQVIYIGVGRRHVTGLHGQQVLLGLFADPLFDDLDKPGQLHRVIAANVVDAVRPLAGARVRLGTAPVFVGLGDVIQRTDDTLYNIVDVGEITLVMAVVEHINRFARQDLLGEDKQRHIRPAPGTVHGKEPQAGGGQVVQLAVGVSHQLIGLLGGRVQAQGVIYVVMHGERHGLVSAVYRAAGGVHQVLHVVMATAFQDIHKANQVGVYVGVGVFQGVTYAGLGGQVHHPLGLVFPEQGFHSGPVCYVLAHFGEPRLAG